MVKYVNLFLINQSKIEFYVIEDKIFHSRPINYKEADFVIKDMKGCFVSYGWIDSHTHCNVENKLYGSDIDRIGYKMGVPIVVDAGSVGTDEVEKMYNFSKNSITNLKILLNISRKGIYKQSELDNLNDLNFTFEKKYENFIIGYKARMSKSVTIKTGKKSLEIFNKYRNENKIIKPLMVHIGNEPPKFSEIINLLQNGDIITHIFNYKNNSIFDKNYNLTVDLKEAINKKIIFDVGHGNDSFNFRCAFNSFKNNFRVNIISTDIYDKNIKNFKVKSLAITMSKFKEIGYSWEEIINCVTVNPANTFNLKKIGKIEDNYFANLTFFSIEKQSIIEQDSYEQEILLSEYVKPIACIVNGKYYEVNNEK